MIFQREQMREQFACSHMVAQVRKVLQLDYLSLGSTGALQRTPSSKDREIHNHLSYLSHSNKFRIQNLSRASAHSPQPSTEEPLPSQNSLTFPDSPHKWIPSTSTHILSCITMICLSNRFSTTASRTAIGQDFPIS